jgi:transposase
MIHEPNGGPARLLLVLQRELLLGIELLFLPSYSPQLNLIERCWRFLRKKCLYSKHCTDFKKFKAPIERCITFSFYEYPAELESLLTRNFQSFKKVQIVTV